jgi:ribosomal protein L19
MTTVDNVVNEHNLNFGLLKLDVEGAEISVLEGSVESIKKFRPVLLISIYHGPEDFFEIKPMLEKMGVNYKFTIRKLAPGSTHGETMLLAYPCELG